MDWSLNLARLKWLAIVAPLAFLVALDYLRHEVFYEQLHGFPGVLPLFAVLAAAVATFSLTIFHVIRVLERRVLEQNRQLSALARIAAASAESPELNDLLNVALDHVLSVMNADAGAICLLDAEAQELVAACHRGFSPELTKQIQRQKLGAEPIGTEVVRSGRPVVTEEFFNAPAVHLDGRPPTSGRSWRRGCPRPGRNGGPIAVGSDYGVARSRLLHPPCLKCPEVPHCYR